MERTVLEERDALSMERLASITKEHTAQEPFGDYFRKTASFVCGMVSIAVILVISAPAGQTRRAAQERGL